MRKLVILLCLLPSMSYGFETFGARWLRTWVYHVDASCPIHVQDLIHERMIIHSQFLPFGISRGTDNTPSEGGVMNERSDFFCSTDFGQDPDPVTSPGFSGLIGRTFFWNQGRTFVTEVDIQINPELPPVLLLDAIDHEILHGMGCAHSDIPDALMFATIGGDKGHHYDDYRCINELYGIPYSLLDYQGTLYIPDARRIDSPESFWGAVKVEVVDSGEN